jgi:hypothetical protein
MRPVLSFLLATLLANPAGAQVTSLDEGSFTLMRGGDRIGREDFSIRSTPAAGGSAIVAHAVISMGARRIEPSLNADTAGAVVNYETTVTENGRVLLKYSGKLARDHFSARSSRPEGESSREFRLPAGTVAVEDEVVHQLWFVARRGPGASVKVLSPLRNVVETVRVSLVGDEHLTIDNHDLEARHLRLVTEGSGAVRDVWEDAGGRLLKVVIAATKFVAVRDEVPR